MTVRFVSLTPERASFAPGEPWQLRLRVRSSEPADAVVRIRAVLAGPPDGTGDGDPAGQAGPEAEYRVRLERGLTQLPCALAAPPAQGGYLVEAEVETPGGTIAGRGSADVLADWRADPRYGFLSEFGPGDTGQPGRVATMAGLHLNCAQFYDWAYRHDQLLPPATAYRDPIGRELSLDSVRASITACRDRGIAPLGYAALYAGLPDFAAAHRDWQITDGAGRPEHLAELFYLMNPADPGWRAHLLGQLDQALGGLDFDGFHLDQYGYPRTAWDRAGDPVDVGAGLASLVRAAAARVAAARPGGGVIANAVGAWPLPDFAPVPQVATYVEVWEPCTRYEDLVSLAERARLLAARPVLFAAYPAFLGADPRPGPGPASGGLSLLVAVTLAAGAWPFRAGEGERVLVDPYYPNHVLPPARARTELARLLDFGVAFRTWLRGPRVRAAEPAFIAGPAAEWQFSRPHSARPEPGRIWARASTTPGWTVLSLVNLLGVTDPSWDRPQPPARPGQVTITLPRHLKDPACWAASPERGLERLPVTEAADGRQVTVPLTLWTLLMIADSSAR
jgi:dextranase